MSLTNLALTLACVAGIAVGQIFFKLAARAASGAAAVLPWDFLNPYLFTALAIYAAATFLWVWLLKTLPLNVAYPFVGLAFIIVPLLAAFFLHEPLDWRNLAGGVLIASGVALASWH
jgi:drug/metabolite transporter (DMT)-like permease